MTWTTDFCLRQKAEQTGVVFLVGFVVRFTISNLWINLSIYQCDQKKISKSL